MPKFRPIPFLDLSAEALAEFNRKVMQLVKKNADTGLFSCILCFKEFRHRSSAGGHLRVEHLDGVSFTCKFCPMTFKAKQRLDYHVFKKHREANKLDKVFGRNK
jgi:hypothetical protein